MQEALNFFTESTLWNITVVHGSSGTNLWRIYVVLGMFPVGLIATLHDMRHDPEMFEFTGKTFEETIIKAYKFCSQEDKKNV